MQEAAMWTVTLELFQWIIDINKREFIFINARFLNYFGFPDESLLRFEWSLKAGAWTRSAKAVQVIRPIELYRVQRLTRKQTVYGWLITNEGQTAVAAAEAAMKRSTKSTDWLIDRASLPTGLSTKAIAGFDELAALN